MGERELRRGGVRGSDGRRRRKVGQREGGLREGKGGEGLGGRGEGGKECEDVQMRAHGFLRSDVVDVRAGDAETARRSGKAARARAGGGDGSEVGAVGGVAEVECAGGGYGVAEALGDGRC